MINIFIFEECTKIRIHLPNLMADNIKKSTKPQTLRIIAITLHHMKLLYMCDVCTTFMYHKVFPNYTYILHNHQRCNQKVQYILQKQGDPNPRDFGSNPE